MTATLWELARRRKKWGATWQSLAYVGLTAWTLLAVLSAFYFPAGSYLCAWPALAGVLAVGLVFAGAPVESPWTIAALALGAAPGVLLIVPLALLLFTAFGVDVAALAAIALVVVLLLWSLAPLVVGMGLRRWLLVISAAASIVFLARGAAEVRYSAENPRHENIVYALDADAGTAIWVNGNITETLLPGARPDEWAAQYVSASPAKIVTGEYDPLRVKFPGFDNPAPVLPLALPEADVHVEAAGIGGRLLRVLLRSPRHAREIRMIVKAEPLLIRLLAINGRLVEQSGTIPGSGARRPEVSSAAANNEKISEEQIQVSRTAPVEVLVFRYSGLTDAGVEVVLAIDATSPEHAAAQVHIQLTDFSAGLPEIPGRAFRPRPASISTQHSADMTMVTKSYSF